MESTEIPSNPSNQNDWNRSSSRSGWGLSGRLLLAGLFLLAILAAGAYSLSSPAIRQALSIGKPPTSKYMTETVKRAPFRIAVTERGTLDSLKSATLASQVEGTTTIISLVPEGTLVEKGEVVCELDSSQLIQEEKEQQIAVTTAEADLKKAEENLEIQKRQNESDIAAARLAGELAQLDLEKYREGESIQLENEIKGEITVAEEELARSVESYEFSKRLAKKGYKSQNDVEADRIAVTKTQIKRDVALDKLKVLKNYTYRRTIRELEEMADESVRELDRVRRQAAAALAQFEADFKAKKLTYEVQKGKLERCQKQIAACTIRAPQPGEVVYNTDGGSRRSEGDVIEVGVSVRERQPIIKLPDLSQMKVDARIHESKISRVRPGLPVIIRVDAYPNNTLIGVVDHVSSVPVSGRFPNYDLKQYESIIRIESQDDPDIKLKPGLTASLEIIVEERSNVLQTPVQSVITVGRESMAYVMTPTGPERRSLLIGKSNDQFVEVLDGVQAGEQVVMNPRSHFAEEISRLQASQDRSQTDRVRGATLPIEVPAEPASGSGPSADGEGERPRPQRPAGVGPGEAGPGGEGSGRPEGGRGADSNGSPRQPRTRPAGGGARPQGQSE